MKQPVCTKRIIYTSAEGGVVIVQPLNRRFLIDADGSKVWEPEDAWFHRAQQKLVPKGATDVRTCDVSELPQDRTFRDAWKIDGKGFSVDMDKAREVQRKRLAGAKIKAERLAQRQAVHAEKHPDIDAAQTPEELAKVTL